jgi:hypothetical protein
MCLVYSASAEHTKTYTNGFDWTAVIFAAKKEHSPCSIIVLFVLGVIVPATGHIIEHLHAQLLVAFVAKGEHTTSLEVVDVRELLPASVELHLTAPVEEHIHLPSAKAVVSLPQLQRGRLVTGDEVAELVRQLVDAKWATIEDDDELELPLLLGRRRRPTKNCSAEISNFILCLQL